MQSPLPLASLGHFNVNNLIFLGEFGMGTLGDNLKFTSNVVKWPMMFWGILKYHKVIFIKPKYPYRKYFFVLFKLQGLNYNGICYFCLILFQIWMKCHWS